MVNVDLNILQKTKVQILKLFRTKIQCYSGNIKNQIWDKQFNLLPIIFFEQNLKESL